MIYTKEQLILNGEHFFKNANVKSMLASTDGQYFYPEHKSFLDAHIKANKVDWIPFTQDDVDKIKEARKAKVEPKKEAKPITKPKNNKKK